MTMVAFIPELGSQLQLSEDWTFDVHFEGRNESLVIADGKGPKEGEDNWSWWRANKSYKRTFPKDSVFKVDRIYIRNGMKEYSSVTLSLISTSDPVFINKTEKNLFGKKSIARFWVKLIDFNKAKFQIKTNEVLDRKLVVHKGKVLTFGEFKPKKKCPEYYIEYVHPEMNKSFSGYVKAIKESGYYTEDKSQVTHTNTYQAWNPITRQYELYERNVYKRVLVSPKNFVEDLIPRTTLKTRYDENGNQIPRPSYDFLLQINIPREKMLLKSYKIVNDSSLLQDISIEGGKLTIYSVDWK
jgi:hypothetical protein